MSVIAQFAAFREAKKNKSNSKVEGSIEPIGSVLANSPIFQEIPADPVPAPSPALSMDEFLKEMRDHPMFKSMIIPSTRWMGNGSGVAPSRVAALEGRIKNLEDNPSGSVNYFQVTTGGTTTFTNAQLTLGNNIIGVNFAGAVTIRLPDNLSVGTIIEIKDESLAASSNNITIETYIDE